MDNTYEARKLVSTFEDFVNSSIRIRNQLSATFRTESKDHKKDKLLSKRKLTKFIAEKQNLSIYHFSQTKQEFE